MEQAVELRKMATASGGNNVTGLVKGKMPLPLFGSILGLVPMIKVSQPTRMKLCALFALRKLWQGDNTSNLHSHLKVHRPSAAAKVKPSPKSTPAAGSLATANKSTTSLHQPSVVGAFAKSTKYKKDGQKWKVCTEAVARYITKDMVSFYTMEKKAFCEMVKTLDSQYKLPGRKYFPQKAIPNLYNKVQEEVKVLCRRQATML